MEGLFSDDEKSDVVIGFYFSKFIDVGSHKLEDEHYIVTPIEVQLLILF